MTSLAGDGGGGGFSVELLGWSRCLSCSRAPLLSASLYRLASFRTPFPLVPLGVFLGALFGEFTGVFLLSWQESILLQVFSPLGYPSYLNFGPLDLLHLCSLMLLPFLLVCWSASNLIPVIRDVFPFHQTFCFIFFPTLDSPSRCPILVLFPFIS